MPVPQASHDTRCRVPAHLVIFQVEAERVDAGVVLKGNRQISLRIKRPPSQCLCIEMAACSSIMI